MISNSGEPGGTSVGKNAEKGQGLEETHLLPLSSSHGAWFGTLVIDIRPKVVHVGFGRSFGLLDSPVNLCLGLLVDGLEFVFGGQTPILDVFLETTDRILSIAHFLDLVASAVGGTGIGHALNHIRHRWRIMCGGGDAYEWPP